MLLLLVFASPAHEDGFPRAMRMIEATEFLCPMDGCLPGCLEGYMPKHTVPAVDWIAGTLLIARGDSSPVWGKRATVRLIARRLA